jgi:hypothetical protein
VDGELYGGPPSTRVSRATVAELVPKRVQMLHRLAPQMAEKHARLGQVNEVAQDATVRTPAQAHGHGQRPQPGKRSQARSRQHRRQQTEGASEQHARAFALRPVRRINQVGRRGPHGEPHHVDAVPFQAGDLRRTKL